LVGDIWSFCLRLPVELPPQVEELRDAFVAVPLPAGGELETGEGVRDLRSRYSDVSRRSTRLEIRLAKRRSKAWLWRRFQRAKRTAPISSHPLIFRVRTVACKAVGA